MPVLPLVASTTVVRPGSIRPSCSAASIIATPIRSLTDPPGLNISSLPKTSAPPSGARRASWTIGVRPTWSAMLIGMEPIDDLVWQRFLVVVDAPHLAHSDALVELDRVRVVRSDVEPDGAAVRGGEHGLQQPRAEALALVVGVHGEQRDVERVGIPAAHEREAPVRRDPAEGVVDVVAVE